MLSTKDSTFLWFVNLLYQVAIALNYISVQYSHIFSNIFKEVLISTKKKINNYQYNVVTTLKINLIFLLAKQIPIIKTNN